MASNYVDRTIKIPVSQPTVTLDPDKYLGTIGLAADKPAGSPAPHYTAFPEDAKAGNWLQVVSEFTLGGQLLLRGEEWYCFRAKTDTQASVWTRSQIGEKQPVYVSVAQNIGEIRAFLYNNTPAPVKSNEFYFIPWGNVFCTGIYSKLNKTAKTGIINITPGLEPHIEHDYYLNLQFANDRTGNRWGTLNMWSYYPIGSDLYSTGLEEFIIKGGKSSGDDPMTVIKQGTILPVTEPLDDTPLVYGISCYVSQNSGNDLNLIAAELKIKSYYKIY